MNPGEIWKYKASTTNGFWDYLYQNQDLDSEIIGKLFSGSFLILKTNHLNVKVLQGNRIGWLMTLFKNSKFKLIS